MKRTFAVFCLLASVTTGIAACGGGSDSTAEAPGKTVAQSTPPAETEAPPDQPKKGSWGAVVRAQSEHLGIVLFDLSGHTLYRFEGDKGPVSTCYGACAKVWRPALTEGPVRPMEVPRRLVGTSKRKDGTVQLTYAGHPLYTHSGVRQGNTSDNGVKDFGARWYALRVNGEDATD